jgi:hypothetical protein
MLQLWMLGKGTLWYKLFPKTSESEVSTNWVSDCHPATPEVLAPEQFSVSMLKISVHKKCKLIKVLQRFQPPRHATIMERTSSLPLNATIHINLTLLYWTEIQLQPLRPMLPRFDSVDKEVTLPSSVPINTNDGLQHKEQFWLQCRTLVETLPHPSPIKMQSKAHCTRNATIVEKKGTLPSLALIRVCALRIHHQQM